MFHCIQLIIYFVDKMNRNPEKRTDYHLYHKTWIDTCFNYMLALNDTQLSFYLPPFLKISTSCYSYCMRLVLGFATHLLEYFIVFSQVLNTLKYFVYYVDKTGCRSILGSVGMIF
jgi:hypothetical protein